MLLPISTLYHIPKTISSPIVQCLLELDVVGNGVDVYETNFQEIKTETFLLRNPMGTSPTLEDDNIVLWESGAVLDYLLERYDTENRLAPRCLSAESLPEHSALRAKYLHVKQYIIATVYPFVASLFLHTQRSIEEQDEAYIQSTKRKWTSVMAPVLSQWLGEGTYFLGDQMTAVDFLVCKPLNNANSLGMLVVFPRLKSLLDRMKCRPTFRLAYEALPPNEESHYNRSILVVPGMTTCQVSVEDSKA